MICISIEKLLQRHDNIVSPLSVKQVDSLLGHLEPASYQLLELLNGVALVDGHLEGAAREGGHRNANPAHITAGARRLAAGSGRCGAAGG